MSSKRPICSACARPLSTCLCDVIVRVDAPLPIVIWQDPREAKHALSTTPLLLASVSNSKRIVTRQLASTEITHATQIDWRKLALVYPADAVSEMKHSLIVDGQDIAHEGIEGLLLLDGTWKHVKRMLLTQPWLNQLPRLALHPAETSRYRIRATGRSDSLSTMEAALLACHQIAPSFDWQKPLVALDKMVATQLAHGQHRTIRSGK